MGGSLEKPTNRSSNRFTRPAYKTKPIWPASAASVPLTEQSQFAFSSLSGCRYGTKPIWPASAASRAAYGTKPIRLLVSLRNKANLASLRSELCRLRKQSQFGQPPQRVCRLRNKANSPSRRFLGVLTKQSQFGQPPQRVVPLTEQSQFLFSALSPCPRRLGGEPFTPLTEQRQFPPGESPYVTTNRFSAKGHAESIHCASSRYPAVRAISQICSGRNL
jgi:hypothetical protein